MFDLLWRSSEKPNNASKSGLSTGCCGDREKEDDPRAASLVPAPIKAPTQAVILNSENADVSKAYPEVLDSPSVGPLSPSAAFDLSEMFQEGSLLDRVAEAAELTLEGELVKDSMVTEDPDYHEDGFYEDGVWVPHSSRVGEFKKLVLNSYEDREYTTELECIQSTDSDDSDEEKLKVSAKNLRESMKKVAGMVKGKKDECDVEGTVFDSIKDQMESMKAATDHKGHHKHGHSPAAADTSEENGNSGARLVRSQSIISTTSAISRETSGQNFGDQIQTENSQASGIGGGGDDEGMTMGITRATSRTSVASINTLGLGGAQTIGIFAVASVKDRDSGEDEDDDEGPDANADDEAAINKKYNKRYHGGMENKVEELRDYMERVGIEEPAAADARNIQKAGKVFTLDIVFLVKNELEQWEERLMTFRRKPIGIKWDRRAPITIAAVNQGSDAEHMMIDTGWIVKEINQVDFSTKKYRETYDYLIRCVNWLPTAFAESIDSAKPNPNEALDIVLNVTIESASGFNDNYAQHFCVCEIPGKAHSRVETCSQCVDDTPDSASLEWHQTYEIFDFQVNDSIELAIFAMQRVVSEHGEDTSLGRIRLGWSHFSRGFQGELSLIDRDSGLATKTKMKVTIQVEMVPERQKAIHTYRRIMKDKLVALHAKEKDINASFKSPRKENFSSCADAVRASLRDYHKQSELLGKYYPFPGEEKSGNAELEQDAARKLKDYGDRLENDDPERLWVKTTDGIDGEELGFNRMGSCGSLSMSERMTVKFSREKEAERRQDCLEVVFLDKKKVAHIIVFTRQPIGIEFKCQAPLKVTGFLGGSHALELGVEKGWKIDSIDGVECSKMRYSEASKLLYDNLATLPHEEAHHEAATDHSEGEET